MAEPLTDERLAYLAQLARDAAEAQAGRSLWDGPSAEADSLITACDPATVVDLVTEVRRLRAFIEGLMGDECTAFDNYLTGGPGSCPESDWPRDRWCLHCRSRVALAGHMEVGTG